MAVWLGCPSDDGMPDSTDVARKLLPSPPIAPRHSQSDQQPGLGWLEDSELLTGFADRHVPTSISFNLMKMHVFLLPSYLATGFHRTRLRTWHTESQEGWFQSGVQIHPIFPHFQVALRRGSSQNPWLRGFFVCFSFFPSLSPSLLPTLLPSFIFFVLALTQERCL